MKRVLVVDDHHLLARLLKEALLEDGHVVRVVSDAAAAYACILQHWPDLMLLDANLPGMDGWTFLGACRQDAWAAHLPILMLAAPPGPAHGEPGRLAFLPKPFDLAALSHSIGQLAAGASIQPPVSERDGAGDLVLAGRTGRS